MAAIEIQYWAYGTLRSVGSTDVFEDDIEYLPDGTVKSVLGEDVKLWYDGTIRAIGEDDVL
ncbi:MAG TPA: hypothetical protein VN608_09320 [Clostridia bacterium]|nr:hypothetical protein [Clostridia bacterium]